MFPGIAVLTLFCASAGAEEIQTEHTGREIFLSSLIGNDANPGTSAEKPLRTIQKAIGMAAPGDSITLLPGWYEGGIRLKPGEKGRPITVRASRKGRVFLGKPSVLKGFQKAEGLEYTDTAEWIGETGTILEVDTNRMLREMATPIDVEELAGTCCFDPKSKKLFIHPTDSAGVSHHLYRLIGSGIGITLADYTVVDGLTLTGFGRSAIEGNNPTGAVVRNCVAYGNGYAISFRGGTDCIISGSEVWNNCPDYDEGAQIHISGAPAAIGFVVENNIAYDSPHIGIRFYSGKADNCIARGNLVYGNQLGGFYYKMNDTGKLFGTGNVCLDNANNDFSAPLGGHNTFRRLARDKKHDTDLQLGGEDWRFVDPAYRDYRLQSDSPARGVAPDGSDLGAFQYDGSVVFVKPDGNDATEGTSVATAWKTLAHASKSLKPGQTLYIFPGKWEERLELQGLKASEEKPTTIRVHGKDRATVLGIKTTDVSHLTIEGLRIAGKGGQDTFTISQSQGVKLRQAVSSRDGGAGLALRSCRDVVIESCGFSSSRVGVRMDALCGSIEIVSSIFSNELGMECEKLPAEFNSDFNVFIGAKTIGMLGGKQIRDLESWRRQTATGINSRTGLEEAVPGLKEKQDFRVRAGTPIAFAGRYGRPAGPDGVVVTDLIPRTDFERVETLSTTRTSANISWWTPGRICGTVIQWGETAKYGKHHERANEEFGEYEALHNVSLLGLQPEKTYHFRVGYRDFHAPPQQKVNGMDPIRWSGDFTFTTADTDPVPRQLYVSLEGNDSNDGLTPATAWRSLHKTARQARAGDTVTIAPGRYMELLRPLHSGTGEDRRITFRAEKPLSVFLDGGFIKFKRDGRSHSIQIMNKAYLTFENLTCENVRAHDNGGYRGGAGYAGLIGISGSAAIEIKSCVMDGRSRYMPCMWVFEAGKMPGVPAGTPGFTATDSLFLYGWRSFGIRTEHPCIFRNNAFVRALTAMFTVFGGTRPKGLIMRNNIYQSLIYKKRNNVLWNAPLSFDSDYNCFTWDPDNPNRYITWQDPHNRTGPKLKGLGEWQMTFGQDKHSIETDPGYPLSKKMGFGNKGAISRKPLSFRDLILPPDSPCRKKGEGGEDIGPRWERFKEEQK